MASRGLSRFEWACVGVVGVAFALRAHMVLQPVVIWDSAWYLMLARSFAEDGTFWVRWTDPPVNSTYWAPLFPILVSPLVQLLGASYSTLVLGSVLASAALTLATLATTWDLFGRTRAFAAMALVGCSPAFLATDSRGMSESALALMVVLAAWAFLKSIDRPPWLLAALGFGALAYLAKANLGVPLVAAGLVALAAWRVRSRGLRATLRSPWDVGIGVAAFALLASIVAYRATVGEGLHLGGVGVGLIEPVRVAATHPMWVPFVVFKLLFAAAFLLVVTLPLSLRVLAAARARVDERAGALWLATLFPLVATALFTASFLITEKRGPTEPAEFIADPIGALAGIVDFDNIRYLTPAIVPFAWLLLPHVRFEDDPPAPPGVQRGEVRRAHEGLYAAAVALFALLLLLNPLGGVATLGRLYAFFALALVPLGLALLARRRSFAIAERRSASGIVERRYVDADPEPLPWRPMLAVSAVACVLAYVVASWYAIVALGLLVAVATPVRRGQVVAMGLVLALSNASYVVTGFPGADAARAVDALPAGTVVGVSDPAVYFAAIAPSDVALRKVDPAAPPDGVDAVLVTNRAGADAVPGFVQARVWDYALGFSPPLAARVAVEQGIFGEAVELRTAPALALYVRNGTAAHEALLPG